MDELNNTSTQEQSPAPAPEAVGTPAAKRVRKPTSVKVFKETYLPFLILGAAAVMIVLFIIGSLVNKQPDKPADTQSNRIAELLQQEVQELKDRAAALAELHDYAGAMACLDSYSAGLDSEPSLQALYNEYQEALDAMVVWDDPAQVPGLSFRTLVADLSKAGADPNRGNTYRSSYVTTAQFSEILQQLYDNGYVLVHLQDFDGEPVRLPLGKKPIVLTQEGVNYYSHTRASGGFARRLVLDDNGALTCAMPASDGSSVTGAFDFVPILNAFVENHPDFSYNGAKATIAVSGYEGLFGYELSETEQITAVAETLLADGYVLACYTYADMSYANYGEVGLRDDLAKWTEQVEPLLGKLTTLVYPTGGDIRGQEAYSGAKYEALKEYGFRYFSGVANGTTWGMADDEYLRHFRTVVTPKTMRSDPEYYTGLFDPATVLAAE